jgi:hypothetical protein
MSNKRTQTLGLHEWTKNDTILTMFTTKYGNKGIYLRDEKSIAKFIGVTTGSLKMQSANFRSLLGTDENALSDYSKLQKEVFDEFSGMGQYEFTKLVKVIIGQDEIERNEILKKMGKDPSKMKRV